MLVGPGDTAPDIDLPDDEGNRWRLRDQRGRPVLLVFHRHFA
jgi:peroxiredoxin